MTAKKPQQLILTKKGKKYIIPDDYVCRHNTDPAYPDTYFPPGSIEPKNYLKVDIAKKKDDVLWKYMHQFEDNTVFRVLNDLHFLEVDRRSLDGISYMIDVFLAILPYDEYDLLKNINSITYLIQNKKQLIDVEKHMEELQQIRDLIEVIVNQAQNPVITDAAKGLIAAGPDALDKRK